MSILSNKSRKLVDSSNFAKILWTREGLYGLLSQSYLTEPSLEFLYELDAQVSIISKNKLFHKGTDLLHAFFENFNLNIQEKQQSLVKEFTYLFLAPGAHQIHPYESVHCSKNRLFKQEPYDQVVQVLRGSGLEKMQECRELEDHIALEFEYMEIMCAETRFAVESNKNGMATELLDKQLLFLAGHILRWVPAFCETVYTRSKTQFYQGIALLTDAFISSEKIQIDILKTSLSYCE